MDYDQTAMPTAYDAGRGYSPEVLAAWLDVIARAVADIEVRDILDLGCGTGRYSAALAGHFGAQVTAVDPSEKMLAEAAPKASGADVTLLRGAAEAVPLPDASVDLVFISMAFHHFPDRDAAARECRRVLRAGGKVCLRAGVSDHIADYPYTPFFPRTPELIRRSLPTLAATQGAFTAAGFELASHEVVPSVVGAGWSAYADKVAHRADSILVQLTDAEFEAGMTALRNHAAAQATDEPVIEPVDFLVFRRPRKTA